MKIVPAQLVVLLLLMFRGIEVGFTTDGADFTDGYFGVFHHGWRGLGGWVFWGVSPLIARISLIFGA